VLSLSRNHEQLSTNVTSFLCSSVVQSLISIIRASSHQKAMLSLATQKRRLESTLDVQNSIQQQLHDGLGRIENGGNQG
jgi:hypothetical protein